MHSKELFACLVLSFVFGIVHAYSVLVVPLEDAFDASRSLVSFAYSLSLMSLTFMVLLGHSFYGRFAPARIGSVALLVGAFGCFLAAISPTLPFVWIGYGLLFGAANGVGYGFALQFSKVAWQERGGLAMGLVTAFYAFGAMLASPVLFWVVEVWSGQAGFVAQGLLCLAVLPVFAGLTAKTSLSVQTDDSKLTDKNTDRALRAKARTGLIWCSYGAAVFAGLMTISQATEILAVSGIPRGVSVLAPILIAASNLFGAVLGGLATDRFAGKWILAGLPVGTAFGIGLLVGGAATSVLMAGLLIVGFFYGATIAAYPAWISGRFGTASGIRVYGRVFTAWGAAGLFAPVLAGAAFDVTGSYATALGLSAALAILSCLVSFAITRPECNSSGSR